MMKTINPAAMTIAERQKYYDSRIKSDYVSLHFIAQFAENFRMTLDPMWLDSLALLKPSKSDEIVFLVMKKYFIVPNTGKIDRDTFRSLKQFIIDRAPSAVELFYMNWSAFKKNAVKKLEPQVLYSEDNQLSL